MTYRFAVCLLVLLTFSGCASTGGMRTPARYVVQADNHQLTLWAREVPASRGSVLLIHGRTWSALPDFDLQVKGETNRSVMRAFNARGYSAYALDMRGYGATPRDATGWLTPDRAAKDVTIVLQWLGSHTPPSGKAALRRPVLVGWSMGSRVAHLVAQRHPELVSDLVLFGHPSDLGKPRQAPAVADIPPREPTTRSAALSDFISPAVTPPAVIEAYVKAALASDPIRVDWRELHQFNEMDPAKLRVPTLLMHGERDPLTPLDAQARMFTALGNPDRQWVILPGGDHAALIEDTAPAFMAAIIAFIERPRAQ